MSSGPSPSTSNDLDTPITAVYIKGICAGFVRFKLSRPAGRDATWHCWTLFLMSNCGLDLSPFVEKVTFVIHRDFSSCVRSLYDPPYETTVIGQSGFEAFIHVTYRDPKLPPSIISVNIIVDAEDYTRRIFPDMLVFVNPRLWFSRLLDIERICTKQSGVLHHLNLRHFLRQQNAAGRIPYVLDGAKTAAHSQVVNTPEGTSNYEGSPRNGTAYYRADTLQVEYTYPHNSESVGLYQYNSTANNIYRSSMDFTADHIARFFSDIHSRSNDSR